MKFLVRISIIGVAVVIFLALFYVILSMSEPEGSLTGGVVFASGEPTDVESVTVRNSSGEFSFFFDFNEGGYVLDDIPPYIVDIEAFIDFMVNSARLSAVREISADDIEIQDLGLSDPSAEVEIRFFDGQHLSLAIGGVELVSGNFFATVSGFDGVFLLRREAV